MIDTKKKSTISEDLADLAVRSSNHAQETGEMKKQVNLRRKNRKKCTIGKLIDPKDARRGKVKNFTKFEIAVENLLEDLKKRNLEERKLSTYSDIVLMIIRKWKEKAKALEWRGAIDSKQLRDAEGKMLITSPWVTIAIEQLHKKDFLEIFLHRSEKDKPEIDRKEISSQASSIFSSIIKTFVELGLAKKVLAVIGSVKTYYVYEKTYKFSVEELHYLFIEGRKLCKRRKSGEFGNDLREMVKNKAECSEKKCEKCKKIELLSEISDGSIIKKSIEIKTDGTILIEIFYK